MTVGFCCRALSSLSCELSFLFMRRASLYDVVPSPLPTDSNEHESLLSTAVLPSSWFMKSISDVWVNSRAALSIRRTISSSGRLVTDRSGQKGG